MHRTVLALLLGIAFAATAAAPAQAAALTRLTGRLAEAEFVSQDGCVVTSTLVFAVDDAGGPFAYAQYVRQDACTGALLGYATAGRSLQPGELAIDASLRRAALRAAMTGSREDGSSVTFDVWLDWDASGQPSISLAAVHVRSPLSTFGMRGFNRFYDAEVTGIVLDGPADLADGEATRGRLGMETSGTLVLDTQLLAAASGAATVVGENDRIVFDEVGAAFGATDASGCVFSQVFLFASDGTRQTPGGPSRRESLMSLLAFAVDNCRDTMLLDGYGERALESGELSVNRNLSAAHIAGSIELSDRVSGGAVMLPFEVTWTATGEATMSVAHDVQMPPFTTHHAIVTSRPATAAGMFPGVLVGVTENAGIGHLRGGEVSH